MPRLVSVDDEFNLPDSVNVRDTNLPANLQPAALSATYAPAYGSPNYAPSSLGASTSNNATAVASLAAPKWGES